MSSPSTILKLFIRGFLLFQTFTEVKYWDSSVKLVTAANLPLPKPTSKMKSIHCSLWGQQTQPWMPPCVQPWLQQEHKRSWLSPPPKQRWTTSRTAKQLNKAWLAAFSLLTTSGGSEDYCFDSSTSGEGLVRWGECRQLGLQQELGLLAVTTWLTVPSSLVDVPGGPRRLL